MGIFKRSEKPTLTPTERAVRRTSRTLTAGRWFLIAGLVFYSLMTTTPFVAAHSEWQWSGFVLGLIVDAAFIMALSAEGTLAKFGVTELGKWPVAFRWFTGLSSVFLNTWVSIERGDAVGVAVHLIAPALVMLLAEVGPVYMSALARAAEAAERNARTAWKTRTFAEHYGRGPESLTAPQTAPERETAPADPEPLSVPQKPADSAARMHVENPPLTVPDPIDVAEDFAAPVKGERLSKAEADKIIEDGWRHKLTVKEVAAAATRHPATVSRKFKELDVALSV